LLFRETGILSPLGRADTSKTGSSVPKAPDYTPTKPKTFSTRLSPPPPSVAKAATLSKKILSIVLSYAASRTAASLAAYIPLAYGSVVASILASHKAGPSIAASIVPSKLSAAPPAADIIKIIKILINKESNKDHEVDGYINVPNYKSK